MNIAINRRQSLLWVFAIVGIAIVLSISSYLFFNDAASRTIEIAAGEDRTSARILAHDLANSLANKISGIERSVQIVAQSPPVQDGNVEEVRAFLGTTQQTTSDLTDFYGWAGSDGRIVWISAAGEDAGSAQFIGVDRSGRDWFANARDTGQGYASSAIESLDGTDRIFISYPIISHSGFEGVIYAGVPLAKINSYVAGQLYQGKEVATTLMDMKGTVLQTRYADLLGMSYSSKEYQAAMAGAEKADDSQGLQKFMQRAFDDPSSGPGVADFTYGGQAASVAYSYVRIGNADFAVVFTKVPHAIAANVEALIDQQRLASMIRIAVVGAAAALISILVMLWNSRLKVTVADRTQELAARTEELLAANEQLKQNDRLQKEFINIAAHELRTPITPILTSMETAERVKDEAGGDRFLLEEEYHNMILRNVKRLERLSSDILQAARIESGTFRLGKEKFDLKKVINDVVVDATKSVPNSKRDIQIAYEPDRKESLIVEADQSKMYQVLTNLMQNAIRFTTEGRIAVITESDGQNVTVRVRDTGSGIAQDILPQLFQKFASAPSSRALGGTGLGLYISKTIIEAHGGKIWAENNPDGKGATFSFSIPLPGSGPQP